MSNWTPQDWAMFFTAAATFLGLVLSAIAAFMSTLAKLKGDMNAKKIDEGTAVVTQHAKVAAYTATEAAENASKVAEQVQSMEQKLDKNTDLTEQAKVSAEAAMLHTGECDVDRARLAALVEDHHSRIANLEGQIATIRVAVDTVSKNVDSTRHEMRGNFQTLMNKVDIMAAGKIPSVSSG